VRRGGLSILVRLDLPACPLRKFSVRQQYPSVFAVIRYVTQRPRAETPDVEELKSVKPGRWQ